MGVTFLLDGKTSVSGEQLTLNMIKAALLANEQAGILRFQVQNNDKLIVVPTGIKANWPAYTLEYRLIPDEKASVSEIVKNWILEKSSDPWDRAITLGKVMLTLRGYCKIVSTQWSGKKYILADDQLLSLSQDSTKVAEELLSNCKQNRPEIWKLLDEEISSAVKSLKKQINEKTEDMDPWLNEAAADRDRFWDQLQDKPIKLSSWIGIPLSILLGALTYYIMNTSKQYTFTIATLIIVTGFILLFYLRVTWARKLTSQLSAWLSTRYKFKGSLPDPSTFSALDRISGTIFIIPLLTLMILLFYLAVLSHPGIVLPVLFFGGALLFRLFQKKAGKAITSKVINETKPEWVQTPVTPFATSSEIPANKIMEEPKKEEVAPAISRAVKDLQTPHLHAVEIEIITAENIQPASEACIKRLEAAKLRSPSIRNVYKRGILFLALSTILLSIIYKVHNHFFDFSPAKNNGSSLFKMIPVFQIVLFVLTIIFFNSKSAGFIKKFIVSLFIGNIDEVRAALMPERRTEKFASIRVKALHLLGGIWVVAAIQNIFSYASPPKVLEVVLTTVSLLTVTGYLYWIHLRRKDLEKQYPYHSPLNLLALRVFGSSALTDFLELSNSWQWIGTRQRLDGPDTTGHKINDLINYLTGRIDNSIVKNLEDLKEAYNQFKTHPNYELIFPVNSMQCSNATWKEALQKLLNAADVIVVDLSDLSEKNHGIAYEIEKLINELSLQRIVFLVNDSTDMHVLNDILLQAWNNMSPDSPNRLGDTQKISLFSMGGLSSRYPNESAYEWKHRQSKRMNEISLVGLLYNAAQPARNAIAIDSKCDIEWIKWTRVPMPGFFRKLVHFAVWIYMIVVAISVFNYLSHFK